MTATIRDEDTSFLCGAEDSSCIGHYYLDVAAAKLHSLNEAARTLRAAGVPLLATDPCVAELRTERGTAVAPAELPLLIAAREGQPVDTTFLFLRSGQAARRLQYSVTPLTDRSGRVSAILATIVCHAAAPDWATLAGLAHDLRTPLQSLQLMRHALALRTLPETQRQEALERFYTAAERTLRIAEELLEWSRTRGTRAPGSRRDWFPLEPLLREVLDEQAAAAAAKDLKLTAALGVVHGWQIHSDRGRLARVVANLLVNAVRYTPSGGQVKLGAAWEEVNGERCLAIEVNDTGVGISPQDQESIFQPFERGQGGRDQDASGSGVGLSVVDRLTAELGLRCGVQSTAGDGSRFSIRVPQPLLRMAPAACSNTAEPL